MALQKMKWRMLQFNETSEIGTDLFLYKDRSYLLLPSEGEENRFMAKSDRYDIIYYIGSTSLKNLEMMSSFFQKMYNSSTRDVTDPGKEYRDNIILFNSRFNRRFQEYYHPAFVRNITQMPHHFSDLELSYEVAVRSALIPLNRRRFSFYISIGMDAEENVRDDLILSMKDSVRSIRDEAKWKLVPGKGRSSFRFNMFRKPFALSSFINIPTDEIDPEI